MSGSSPSTPTRYTVRTAQFGHNWENRSSTSSQSAIPYNFNDEVEEAHVESQLNDAHIDPQAGVDHVMSPGGLPADAFAEIVKSASEAASLAVFRALESGALRLSQNVPASCNHSPPDLDGNQSETDALQPFRLPPGKRRVPRPNQDKLVDEAMRKFLESKGVLAVKDYYPDDPEDQHVRAYEKHGFFGPDLDAPRICQSQTFKGKWNKQVVDMLTAAFISAVQQGDYNPVQHSWQQMKEDEVRKKCQSKLYRTQYVCRERRKSPMLDKVNRMRQRRQETYYRRRKIHDLNWHKDPEAWKGVELLLDALGTRGTSDDETDNESLSIPDSRFKALRRVDTGFLNPDIGAIWASVESYPASYHPSRGNRSYKRNPKAKSVSERRIPLPGLPVNFYNLEWLQTTPSLFRTSVKAAVPLPQLVGYFVLSGANFEDSQRYIRGRMAMVWNKAWQYVT